MTDKQTTPESEDTTWWIQTIPPTGSKQPWTVCNVATLDQIVDRYSVVNEEVIRACGYITAEEYDAMMWAEEELKRQ